MTRRAFLAILLAGWLAPAAYAQTSEPPSAERQPLGASFPANVIADLPSAATLFSILDTSIAEVISDRVDAGSMTVGQASRLGSNGSSWTQTLFRVGEVDITDPRGSGTPLLIPGVLGWQRMDVVTAGLPMDVNAPGPAITFVPARPAAAWTRSIEFFGAPHALLSRTETTVPPAIARLDGWRSASLFASGQVVPDRLGLVMAASLTNSTHFERSDPTLLNDRLGSVFAHLVYTPNARDEVRVIGWGQRARSPLDHRLVYGQPNAQQRDTSMHVQSEWQRTRDANSVWTGFASFTARRQSSDLAPVEAVVTERLTDGPVADIVAPLGTDRAWSIGGRLTPTNWSRRHTPQGGVTLSGGNSFATTPFNVRIGELVDGNPARVWDYTTSGRDFQAHQVTLAAYMGDTLMIKPSLIVDGGLRFEMVRGSAAGNPQNVSWYDWFPAAGLRWEFTANKRLATLVRFERYGHRLRLGDLAYGDSSSPVGNVYQWTATSDDPTVSQRGALVTRVGPGTGGDAAFSTVDAGLQRPYVNEVMFGFEGRPDHRSFVRLLAVVRHEGQLVGVVNTGAPIDSYIPIVLTDPGVDHGAGQELHAFNKKPEFFGADRFFLTNPSGHHATYAGVEVTAHMTLNKLFLVSGATAGRSEETSANVGFLASENDPGIIGDVYTNPNSETNARGRPFTERGYTIKMAGTYRFTDSWRLGVAARYQDGQHFARLLIVPGLNQGTEAIRAFVNGKTRFTYTMTWDARLQKDFTVYGARLTGILDAYNVFNTRTEIEEFAVTGPLSRTISAVQPPRSIHLGVKLTF